MLGSRPPPSLHLLTPIHTGMPSPPAHSRWPRASTWEASRGTGDSPREGMLIASLKSEVTARVPRRVTRLLSDLSWWPHLPPSFQPKYTSPSRHLVPKPTPGQPGPRRPQPRSAHLHAASLSPPSTHQQLTASTGLPHAAPPPPLGQPRTQSRFSPGQCPADWSREELLVRPPFGSSVSLGWREPGGRAEPEAGGFYW